MNTLSSLPPPSFVTGLAPAPAPAARALLEPPADASPLHVGPAGVRSIDDIERDFVAALCEAPDPRA
jgi:hypothetical protein